MAKPVSHCVHFQDVHAKEPRTPTGCEECLAKGGKWVHLRLCLVCGHVGCCDESPSKHATAHFHETQHPIIRSFEPYEEWGWCFVDEEFYDDIPDFGIQTIAHPRRT